MSVVTAFLENDAGRILLLRRSSKVRTFPGRWGAVSGTMEGPSVLVEARREILEEVGIRPSELGSPSVGRPLLVRQGNSIFRVHPCHFRVHDPAVTLNWENTEFHWLDPTEISRFRTVPKLAEAYRAMQGILPPKRRGQKE